MMKFCSHCGKEIEDEAVICVHCGCGVDRCVVLAEGKDEPNGGHVALGLFFPTIGLILYLLLKGKTPKKAKAIGKGALIGAVVIAVFALLAGIINGVALAAVR